MTYVLAAEQHGRQSLDDHLKEVSAQAREEQQKRDGTWGESPEDLAEMAAAQREFDFEDD